MKRIILLSFGLFNMFFSSFAQDDCATKIKKLRLAYGDKISNILYDKSRTEKLLEDYRSGKVKLSGITANTPSNLPASKDKDVVYWRSKYNTEKGKSAKERDRREETENNYNVMIKEKGKNDSMFQKVINGKDQQIMDYKDTIIVKEKQIDNKDKTIEHQRDTIYRARETIKETTEYFIPKSLQVFALYDAKKEDPYPILVSDKEKWYSENKGLSRERIKRLVVNAEALRSDKSQTIPCMICLYEKVGETSTEKVGGDKPCVFKRDKQLGNLTLYTLKYDEDEFIWEVGEKNIFGNRKRRSIFKSDSKYEIRVMLNDKEYRSDFFIID